MRVETIGGIILSVAMLTTTVANAQNRAPLVWNWTGFYIGGNAGYAFGESNANSNLSCPGAAGTCYFNVPANLAAISAGATGRTNADGYNFGLQAGYNLQSGQFVYGVEVDFNALNLNETRSFSSNFPAGVIIGSPFTTTNSVETEWLFTARGRLGWAITPHLMIFGTGGLAVAEFKISNSLASVPLGAFGFSSASDTKTGYAVGGGAEAAIGGNWTLKGEYLYADFGSVTTVADVNGVAVNPGDVNNRFVTSADLNIHIVRAGLNYRF